MSTDPKKEIDRLKKAEQRPLKPPKPAKRRKVRTWRTTFRAWAIPLIILWLMTMVMFALGLRYSDQVLALFR